MRILQNRQLWKDTNKKLTSDNDNYGLFKTIELINKNRK